MHNRHLLALFRLFKLVARLVLLVVINIPLDADIVKIDERDVRGRGAGAGRQLPGGGGGLSA